ncbi:hypothetical protein K8R78_01940 [bacterium]|nr:hypothetical protein [bacterium]
MRKLALMLLVLLVGVSLAGEEFMVKWWTTDGGGWGEWKSNPGTATGIGIDGYNIFITFRKGGSTQFMVKQWWDSGGGWDEWKSAGDGALPVGIAADNGEIYILFAQVPGASGQFRVKQWDTDGGGWGEWKSSVADGYPVDVSGDGSLVYILYRKTSDE